MLVYWQYLNVRKQTTRTLEKCLVFFSKFTSCRLAKIMISQVSTRLCEIGIQFEFNLTHMSINWPNQLAEINSDNVPQNSLALSALEFNWFHMVEVASALFNHLNAHQPFIQSHNTCWVNQSTKHCVETYSNPYDTVELWQMIALRNIFYFPQFSIELYILADDKVLFSQKCRTNDFFLLWQTSVSQTIY